MGLEKNNLARHKMLSLFTISTSLVANGVLPMAPATRLAAPIMKTSGVKVVVPDKCVPAHICSCPPLPVA